MKTICPPEFCEKFPSMKTIDPVEMFKFALLLKFPSMRVVVFDWKTMIALFVVVPLFGMKFHVQIFWKKTHETFPCFKSNKGAF